jgi:vacuolar-type H+-ATPase subunit I/STV1
LKAWNGAPNGLNYYNSLKMKLSVVLGVTHVGYCHAYLTVCRWFSVFAWVCWMPCILDITLTFLENSFPKSYSWWVSLATWCSWSFSSGAAFGTLKLHHKFWTWWSICSWVQLQLVTTPECTAARYALLQSFF